MEKEKAKEKEKEKINLCIDESLEEMFVKTN